MESDKCLSPFVFWAQTDSAISLRVDLRNAQSPSVDIAEDHLSFSAVGGGAHGERKYSFSLELLKTINTETSRYRVLDRHVEFNISKSSIEFWPRLLKDSQKPPWLKIDFDKWVHEEDLEDEARDIMDDYPGLYEKMQAEEMGWPKKGESLKKIYLFIYNLWQFVGFIYIVSVMATRYLRDGVDSFQGTYDSVGWMVTMCFILQFMEVLHPIVGYTKGSPVEPLMQIGGRGIIYFCLIVCEERMQTKPVVFYLLLVWSLIETVRYPYYMLHVYDIDVDLITWLRYTIWIPLYPVGFVCEGTVILRSLPYLEETGHFTISLPNSWNFAFHFPSFLRCYLLFFFFPVMYKMMSHMYQLRLKKFGSGSKKNK